MTDKKARTCFKNEDVRILREKLSWLYKKVPPPLQEQIAQALLAFAKSIEGYCKCEEKVHIALEGKDACLNCGKRFSVVREIVAAKAPMLNGPYLCSSLSISD